MPINRPTLNCTSLVRDREIGRKLYIGYNDKLCAKLYSSLVPSEPWDHTKNDKSAVHGGVFNLEFSPDGSMLIAACEKRSILLFDPLSQRLIAARDNAHRDCVNCVRFLDSRVFATCSDDSTVALWDARNLKTKIRTFCGHSNWVKNIEFSANEDLLVTSGFDGSIYTWDINSENGYKRVFHTNGLMRTRLSPDASKMVICTTGGYIIVIHDLDLHTLAEDLNGFKPNMYRLMQISQTEIPAATKYTALFSNRRKRNRVEFISDFPIGDDAEVVSSLQIHPQGWCALSRNISNDETSEWTCVHDIQERERNELDDGEGETTHSNASPLITVNNVYIANNENVNNSGNTSSALNSSSAFRTSASSSFTPVLRQTTNAGNPLRRMVLLDDVNIGRGLTSPQNVELHVSSADVWEAFIAIREIRVDRRAGSGRTVRYGANTSNNERHREFLNRIADSRRLHSSVSRHRRTDPPVAVQPCSHIAAGINTFLAAARRQNTGETGSGNFPHIHRALFPQASTEEREEESPPVHGTSDTVSGSHIRSPNKKSSVYNSKVHQNLRRLTHYIEEPNLGRGFIKELCFSSDGRVICSPYGHGVRLLSFSPQCSELSACVPEITPIKLTEFVNIFVHSDIVVSTKFSPQHCLLVSGCLGGKIVWYKPVL